jgi:hypothetical protein
MASKRVGGPMNLSTFDQSADPNGRLVIWADLRLDAASLEQIEPTLANPARQARRRCSPVELQNFFAALDREYKTRPAPTLKAIGDAGVKCFGNGHWRRDFRDQRNELDDSGKPKYPHLYCQKRGRRSTR